MGNFRKAARDIFYALNRNPVSKILYKFEIERRSRLPLTDIESLSKQRKLMNYYCGTDQIKSKRELMKMINKTEDIFKAKYEKTN